MVLVAFTTISSYSLVHGQGTPFLAAPLSPAIHWKDVFYGPHDMQGNAVTQEESSEDWYYDVMEYKQNGVSVGYAAVGYMSDLQFATYTLKDANGQVLECYSAGVQSPNCAYFTTTERPFMHSRQLLVFYDLEGNVTNYYRYNHGELWGITQDDNEDIYLFGHAINPRNVTEYEEVSLSNEPHLTSGQMYYNPTTNSQNSYPLDCGSGLAQYRTKFNVLKVGLNGVVQWNHIYGLPMNLQEAGAMAGIARSGVVKGEKILVGGLWRKFLPHPTNPGEMTQSAAKFLVRLDRNTGYLDWRRELQPGTAGEIFQISVQNDKYLISGIDFGTPPSISFGQGFVSLCTDNGNLSLLTFALPSFYKTVADIPATVDVNGIIQLDKDGRSTSAIFVGNNIFWFLVVNNVWTGFANGIAEGIVVRLDQSGTINAMDAFGEIRAFDLWNSGTPTADGGFALLTSRHSPTYFGTGTLPNLATPLSAADPGGPTIGNCLLEFDPLCEPFNQPTERFWQLMSTCAYVRKYNANFELEWDKLWDSTDNAPRECMYGNLKQQECMYRIIESSVDGGLLVVGNTSDNQDDCYIVKLRGDCGISSFAGAQTGSDLIVDYSDGVYEITGNEVWNTNKKVLGMVRIKPGATLEILNTTIEFATNATVLSGIQVEQNGWLIVNNSTLTSMDGCDDGQWRGIEVWGDIDRHQYNFGNGQFYQGRANLINGARIVNAWEGIQNRNPNDEHGNGGIIQAQNTDFINCRIAAIFVQYQNTWPSNQNDLRPDQSYFNGCNFVLNDDYLGDPNALPPRPRITLWRTDRVRIAGCNFINEQTVNASEKRRVAIYSENANYLVTERCTGASLPCAPQHVQPSTFTGWHKAIEALGSASSRPILVRNSTFDQNMIGVEINGADFSQIYGNTFEVGGHPFANSDNLEEWAEHLGIYSNASLYFSIEQNAISRPLQGAPYEGHGVLVYNSKGAANRIYKNEYSRLKTGTNGWQLNWNVNGEGGAPVGASGLQFLCNTNSHNRVDFETSRTEGLVLDDYDNAGIRWRQGNFSPEMTAGNTFSVPSSDPLTFSHWTVNTDQPYKYYALASMVPSPAEIGPMELTVIIQEAANSCPSNYTTGRPTGVVKRSHLLQEIDAFEGMLYTYNQTIDLGNTPATVTQIQLTWPSQAWQLRDELILRSPFNSETVLMAAIDQNIMPHAMLLEVLLANPDALGSGTVIRHAENYVSPPLPAYMIDLLWASRDQTTLRTAMESILGDMHEKVQRSQKIILTEKNFADSTYMGPDSTLYYLGLVKTVEGNYARAAAMADRDMYSEAISLIDSMQVHYRLGADRYQEMSGLKNLYGIFGYAHGVGKTIANLDSNHVQALEAIAENASLGIAATKAQNALCFHYDICYDRDGQPKSSFVQSKPRKRYAELVAQLNTSTAFPNPADQYVTIGYTLLKANEATSLKVSDNLGRQVDAFDLGSAYHGQQLLDTRKLPNGMYFYQISQDGRKVSEGKFVVIH